MGEKKTPDNETKMTNATKTTNEIVTRKNTMLNGTVTKKRSMMTPTAINVTTRIKENETRKSLRRKRVP